MTDGQLSLWLTEQDRQLTESHKVALVRALCEPVGWSIDVRGDTATRLLGGPASPWPLRGDEREGLGCGHTYCVLRDGVWVCSFCSAVVQR